MLTMAHEDEVRSIQACEGNNGNIPKEFSLQLFGVGHLIILDHCFPKIT